MDTALRLLSGRDHSCRELGDKLRQRGFAASDIAAATTQCLHLNYLNDDKFARLYLQQLRRKGYGRYRIERMMEMKGLAVELIEDQVADQCGEAAQMADCRLALEKKLGKSECDQDLPTLKARLNRFLLNRGFSATIVRQILLEVLTAK